MTLPNVQPILLTSRRERFNGPVWLFEPKYDGYRGLLYVTRQGCWFGVREDLPVRRP